MRFGSCWVVRSVYFTFPPFCFDNGIQCCCLAGVVEKKNQCRNSKWTFLEGVKTSGAPAPRKVIVQQSIRDKGILETICNYVCVHFSVIVSLMLNGGFGINPAFVHRHHQQKSSSIQDQ